jgi:carbon-monoxide dehydrogenase medium subunit
MKFCQEYLRPNSIPEALQALSDSPGTASLLAGGTDLILELQQGHHPPVHTLVDITGIPEMTILEIHGEELYIGAAVPLNRIASSSIMNGHARALLEACSLIGGPQVRNVATLGGNVAHALPAANGTIALMALNAQALVADAQGYRRIPLSQFFLGPGKTSLKK